MIKPFMNNDLHVLKLLKNVQSEPKLNSYEKIYYYCVPLLFCRSNA